MRNAIREALQEPFCRGVLVAALVAGLGFALGANGALVILVAVSTGIVIRELSARFHALQRQALNAESNQVLVRLLGDQPSPVLFGGWAIDSDFGRVLLEQLRRRPRVESNAARASAHW